MIHYDLKCSADHAFDGWFKDSVAFERLAKRGLVECPRLRRREGGACADAARRRTARGAAGAGSGAAPAPTPRPPARSPEMAGGRLPAHMRAMLQKMRAEVERHCDYVGPQFAEEARKIHRGESDKRGIYGEASPEQAEALADEGIQVSQIPWVPRADG